MLAEALAHVDITGERSCAAEVSWLRGELLLRQATPNEAQAETCLHQVLDIARHQEATSRELRVVLSLSRLWQRQGKHAEAHQLLAEICGWFTEEFDTVDLQETQALLEELA
jgi:predicted ATPase